ncbi:MAG: bifunctional diaminohydroxyphosphoribosylaminopyrimidine deaminase/5-amino-6-(5-phosphoribosylamino)uracil reductase RibD [Hyphomicrobium sp.]
MKVSVSDSFDLHMMAIALRMARRGLGLTRPNPSVGAAIADEATGEVIARATTADGGRPHAETQALAAAGSRARGATMYVTLEPCSHVGQTGPCADAIIAAGVTRVVCAIEDPDPRVAGRGLDRLRAAGVAVTRGVGAAEARWVTRGHIVRVTERRPFVTLKLALGQGGVAPQGQGGAPSWATGPEARAHGHVLRAQSDAILVGAGTVRDDDPELTCRLPGLEGRSPIRVVLSRQLDLAPSSKLAATARRVPVWAFGAAPANPARRDALEAAGVDVIEAAEVGGALWLPAVMEALVARGLTRLLVEGGPSVWRAFSDAGLVDEVALYMGGGAAAVTEADARRGLAAYVGATPLIETERRALGPDTLRRLRRAHAKEGS